jgi:hypothetical protein
VTRDVGPKPPGPTHPTPTGPPRPARAQTPARQGPSRAAAVGDEHLGGPVFPSQFVSRGLVHAAGRWSA